MIIPFDELERGIQYFYDNYLCDTCKQKGETNCKQREALKQEEEQHFQALINAFLNEATQREHPEKFQQLKIIEFRQALNSKYFASIDWKNNLKERRVVPVADSVLLEEWERVTTKLHEPSYTRAYYVEWKFLQWLEDFSFDTSTNQTLPSVQNHEYNKPVLSANGLHLLFRQLKDAKVFNRDVANKTINACYEALTGYSGKQINKVIYKKFITEEIKNPKDYEEAISVLRKMIKNLEEQKSRIK